MSPWRRGSAAGAAALTVSTALLGAAAAQDFNAMSCDQLWYARNAVYAQQGYCFETERARAVFGAGCFPPYGHLKWWQQDRVNAIQSVERERGCS